MSNEIYNNGSNDNMEGMNNQNNVPEDKVFGQDSYSGSNAGQKVSTGSYVGQEVSEGSFTGQEASTGSNAGQEISKGSFTGQQTSTGSYTGQFQNQQQNQTYTSGGNAQNIFYSKNEGQSSSSQGSGNSYQGYPTPIVSSEKKPKKKRKLFGAFKFTAAALTFGIIAGAAFQGYYYISGLSGDSEKSNSRDDAKITEVSQNSNDKDTIIPASTTQGNTVTDVSNVVEEVMPSIVAINSTVTTTASDFFGRTFEQEGQSSGSGIIIGQNDEKLLIVTNNHVIDGASSVEITFADKSTASAEIKGADANTDLAILSVNMKDLDEATVQAIKVASLGDSTKVEAGDMAIAIGNALGYGQSVTVGYISAVNREVDVDGNKTALLQTDAAINPGNSGGALLNTEGQVIGINSIKYASTDVEGMGYAIPISSAIPMINELMNRETVSAGEQGYLGIDPTKAQDVTQDISERYNMPVGIYVNEVINDSPAAKAGLEAGDIITGLDNTSIKTIEDLINTLSYKKAGEEIALKLQVKENGAYVEKTLNITLGHR